jgi:uncharacterized membrane protein
MKVIYKKQLKNSYMNKFKKSEVVLLLLVLGLIGLSEYYFVILDQPLKAIFIGLWCPTILGFVMIFNLKGGNGKS